jgi:hypothetical protein
MSEEIYKTKCAGCNKKIESGLELDDESKRMHYVDDILHREGVELCESCYQEWSDIPKGFRLEVNPSTGGLWYRPLTKKEKRVVIRDNLYNPEFMLGWYLKGAMIVIIIAVIAQFL